MQKTLSAKRKNDATLRIQYDKPAKQIHILSANRAAEKLLGYRQEEIKSHPLTYIMPERINTHIHDFLEDQENAQSDLAVMLRRILHFEVSNKDHDVFPASLKVFPMVVDNLNTPEYELLMRDVRLIKKLDDLRDYLNDENQAKDALTGMRNSDSIFASLQIIYEHITSDSHVEASVAFLYVDALDGTRDRYGSEHADRLLRHVAHVINQTVRSGDVVGHIGDNILTMLLIDCNSSDARAAFKRINARLRNSPFVLGKNSQGQSVEIIPTLSLGYKQIQSYDASVERIAEAALDALDRSINSGGNYISEA